MSMVYKADSYSGDFNINFFFQTILIGRYKLRDTLRMYNLHDIISRPTRRVNCLDNVSILTSSLYPVMSLNPIIEASS